MEKIVDYTVEMPDGKEILIEKESADEKERLKKYSENLKNNDK